MFVQSGSLPDDTKMGAISLPAGLPIPPAPAGPGKYFHRLTHIIAYLLSGQFSNVLCYCSSAPTSSYDGRASASSTTRSSSSPWWPADATGSWGASPRYQKEKGATIWNRSEVIQLG